MVLLQNAGEFGINTMQLSAYDEADRLLGEWTVYSIGGGAIQIEIEKARKARGCLSPPSMKDIGLLRGLPP